MLVFAIVLITAALVFYTIGVWAEHRQRVLKPWHAVFFGIGLFFDASGTFAMSRLADSGTSATGLAGGLNTVMIVTGAIAIALMAIHLVWAIIVLARNRESERTQFHKFSLIVWAIWLIPYFAGAIGASIS
ncbi:MULTISPECIES: HsmA family protein [Microterricola]|uniref:TIGR03987 family protein n=2 Tax=Microterricola TaxID=518733 RepID=A0A1H1UTN9_9MICO|nr:MULTISPECIES: HsmA family protein [Microterricola]PPL16943.1 TIGR03987 family protein [Microterricola pindariensis]SDS75456.1 TIGR03987 family protein [Microterricola viridarii]